MTESAVKHAVAKALRAAGRAFDRQLCDLCRRHGTPTTEQVTRAFHLSMEAAARELETPEPQQSERVL